jgi:hypothetical protein
MSIPATPAAPTGWHVLILPESRERCPARMPDVYHRWCALYGAPYEWAPATPEEVAGVLAQDAHYAEHGCYPP